MSGRRYSKIGMDDAMSVSRPHGRSSIICGMCPKMKLGFCSVFAKIMNGSHLACRYGKMLIRAKNQAIKWRVKK